MKKKKAFKGAYGKSKCTGNSSSPGLSPVCLVLHVLLQRINIYDIYKSSVITVSHSRPLSLFLCHCLTHFLSFGHYSKYSIGPGYRLLVLFYLVLGSIRLQAEASHSSQCHKM